MIEGEQSRRQVISSLIAEISIAGLKTSFRLMKRVSISTNTKGVN